jgi:hypothetical protein
MQIFIYTQLYSILIKWTQEFTFLFGNIPLLLGTSPNLFMEKILFTFIVFIFMSPTVTETNNIPEDITLQYQNHKSSMIYVHHYRGNCALYCTAIRTCNDSFGMWEGGGGKEIGCMQWYTLSQHCHAHRISVEIRDKLLLSSELLPACRRDQVHSTIGATKHRECLRLCLLVSQNELEIWQAN